MDKLNVLLRENFSIEEFSTPIKENIKKIQNVLNEKGTNFELEIAQRILVDSTNTIEVISNKVKKSETLDESLNLTRVELDKILRSNFGTERAKQAASLLKKIDEVQSVLEKEELNKEIRKFLGIETDMKSASESKAEEDAERTNVKNKAREETKPTSASKKVETEEEHGDSELVNQLAESYAQYKYFDILCGENVALDEMREKMGIIQSGMLIETPKDKHDELKNIAWEKADELVEEIESYQMAKQLYGAMNDTDRTKTCKKAIEPLMQQYRMGANAMEEILNKIEKKPAKKKERTF